MVPRNSTNLFGVGGAVAKSNIASFQFTFTALLPLERLIGSSVLGTLRFLKHAVGKVNMILVPSSQRCLPR